MKNKVIISELKNKTKTQQENEIFFLNLYNNIDKKQVFEKKVDRYAVGVYLYIDPNCISVHF